MFIKAAGRPGQAGPTQRGPGRHQHQPHPHQHRGEGPHQHLPPDHQHHQHHQAADDLREQGETGGYNISVNS